MFLKILYQNGAFATKEQMFCSKRANGAFSIVFSKTLYFKGVKKHYYGVVSKHI